MDIKLVLSDIDGTILNDENIVDTGLKQAIAEMKKREIPFVLASARSPKGMLDIAHQLDVMDNPIVCYNGALVVKDIEQDEFTTVLSHELENPEVQKIVEIVQQDFTKVSINLYSGADWYVGKTDKWVKIESEITGLKPAVTNLQQFITDKKLPVHKLLLIGDPSEIQQVLERLKGTSLSNNSYYLSKPNYLEITNSQVSKEQALCELAKMYNLSLDKSMTIGDNFNDVPMLKRAGLGVAMQNAPVEVQKCANVVTKSNNQNGVSTAIQKYVLS